VGYRRFVAIGDSFTEGLDDLLPTGAYRGWADRLAARLAAAQPGLGYANLAVRGQKAAQIRTHQVETALRLKPDLVTAVIGLNDFVRPGFEPRCFRTAVDETFAALTDSGATVVTATHPDVARLLPLARPLRAKAQAINEVIRDRAQARGALLLDWWEDPLTVDRGRWSPDRLHPNAAGHELLASSAAGLLGIEPSRGGEPPPAAVPSPTVADLVWLLRTGAPWMLERLLRRALGRAHLDRVAKRPFLLPVDGDVPWEERWELA
jgi:lysophospholipase L1-like esterase